MIACVEVLLDLINFDSAALRARDADTLKGGPNGAVGGLVGLTIGEVERNDVRSAAG